MRIGMAWGPCERCSMMLLVGTCLVQAEWGQGPMKSFRWPRSRSTEYWRIALAFTLLIAISACGPLRKAFTVGIVFGLSITTMLRFYDVSYLNPYKNLLP